MRVKDKLEMELAEAQEDMQEFEEMHSRLGDNHRETVQQLEQQVADHGRSHTKHVRMIDRLEMQVAEAQEDSSEFDEMRIELLKLRSGGQEGMHRGTTQKLEQLRAASSWGQFSSPADRRTIDKLEVDLLETEEDGHVFALEQKEIHSPNVIHIDVEQSRTPQDKDDSSQNLNEFDEWPSPLRETPMKLTPDSEGKKVTFLPGSASPVSHDSSAQLTEEDHLEDEDEYEEYDEEEEEDCETDEELVASEEDELHWESRHSDRMGQSVGAVRSTETHLSV